MKASVNVETVGVVVYRDTIEQHDYDSNLSEIVVTKEFANKYFEEVKKKYYDDMTADEWFNEIYTADDTEDFYGYAKDHNEILNVKHLNMENEIESEINCLKVVGDCFGYNFGNGKGVFVEIVDYGEGLEYLIERNYVDDYNTFEPYGYHNESCNFGQLDKCINIITEIYNEE